MILPVWATPLQTPALCECEPQFEAVARVAVVLKRRRPAGWRGAERDYVFRFTYNLCLVCLQYEREVRDEISFAHCERIVAALVEALAATPRERDRDPVSTLQVSPAA